MTANWTIYEMSKSNCARCWKIPLEEQPRNSEHIRSALNIAVFIRTPCTNRLRTRSAGLRIIISVIHFQKSKETLRQWLFRWMRNPCYLFETGSFVKRVYNRDKFFTGVRSIKQPKQVDESTERTWKPLSGGKANARSEISPSGPKINMTSFKEYNRDSLNGKNGNVHN